MSRSRSFSWSAALRQIRSDRIQYAPGERRAMLRQRAFAELSAKRALSSTYGAALIAVGSYNRRGIMRAAIASAKARREVTGDAWGACLSAALKGTWQAAKAAMLLEKLRDELKAGKARQPTQTTPKRPMSVTGELDHATSESISGKAALRCYSGPILPLNSD